MRAEIERCELVYKKAFFDSVGNGISDAESGKVFSTKEIEAELSERRRRKGKRGQATFSAKKSK